MSRYGLYFVYIALIHWLVVTGLSEDDHSNYMDRPPSVGPYLPPPSANLSLSLSNSSGVSNQHYGDEYRGAGYQPYRHNAQGQIRIDPAVKDATYMGAAAASYPVNKSSIGAVKDQHYGQQVPPTDYRAYRNDAQNYIRTVNATTKMAPYLNSGGGYPANSSSVADQHYGQPYLGENSRAYRSQNYVPTVDSAVKNSSYGHQYAGPGYGSGYAQSYKDQQYGQPYAGDYSAYRRQNYSPKVDPAVKDAAYGQQYSGGSNYAQPYVYTGGVKDQQYGQPYAGDYRSYRTQNYSPVLDPAVKNASYGQQYGGYAAQSYGGALEDQQYRQQYGGYAQPYNKAGAAVKDQQYGQPYSAPSSQTYRSGGQYAPNVDPAIRAPSYGQAYAADDRSYAPNYASRTAQPMRKDSGYSQLRQATPYTPANASMVREQFYGQPHTGTGYRHYRTDGRGYKPQMQGVQDAPYMSPNEEGDYHEEQHDSEEEHGLCAPAQTRVDRTLYCGIPNLLRGQQLVYPEKMAGEWYMYRHSPVGPAYINSVFRVRILGRTEIPSTHYPAVGVWYTNSGYESSQDYSCSDTFYAGYIGMRGTQIVDVYYPERAPIVPTTFHTLHFDERRGLWVNYECEQFNAASGVCAVPSICVNVRERPDLMSRDDQAGLDATINQVLSGFCMDISQLPKQIYTNHKGPCPEPKIPEWLNMKIQGIVKHQRKIDVPQN